MIIKVYPVQYLVLKIWKSPAGIRKWLIIHHMPMKNVKFVPLHGILKIQTEDLQHFSLCHFTIAITYTGSEPRIDEESSGSHFINVGSFFFVINTSVTWIGENKHSDWKMQTRQNRQTGINFGVEYIPKFVEWSWQSGNAETCQSSSSDVGNVESQRL